MKSIIVLETVDSTQDEVIRRFKAGEEVEAVLASEQTAGRGRFGRSWLSTEGSLAISFVWIEAAETPWPAGLALAAGLAAAEVFDTQIAWPNDLMHGDKKVGGLLSEVVSGVPILGLGVNLIKAPHEVPWATHLGTKMSALHAACLFLDRIQDVGFPENFSRIENRWRARDATPGKSYTLPDGRIASAEHVTSTGELAAIVDGERITVLSAQAIYGSGS